MEPTIDHLRDCEILMFYSLRGSGQKNIFQVVFGWDVYVVIMLKMRQMRLREVAQSLSKWWSWHMLLDQVFVPTTAS